MAPRSLDPYCFPHIVEEILGQLDYNTLIAVRQVSQDMCGLANRILLGDGAKLAIMSKQNGGLSFRGPRGKLPFFHPRSRMPWQKETMQRAQHVSIAEDVSRSPRLGKLLMHLPPTCHVKLYHARGDQSFRLPEIAHLMLLITDSECDCSSRWASPFQHSARRVTLVIKRWCPEKCQLIRTFVNPAIERLELRCHDHRELPRAAFNLGATFPKLPRYSHLRVELHWRRWSHLKDWYAEQPPVHEPEVIRLAASYFEIEQSQVTFKTSEVARGS